LPKIVNKEQKRLEIANSSKELLIEKGIAKLTVSEVAKNAGIGKGTIYQYFTSKDDIVFAIMDAYIEDELQKLDEDLAKVKDCKQKLYRYFDFVIQSAKEYRQKQMKGYLEYLSIAIVSDDKNIKSFNAECRKKFKSRLEKIIDEGIAKNELLPIAKELIGGLYAVEKGFVVISGSEDESHIDKEMTQFLDAIITLIEVKK